MSEDSIPVKGFSTKYTKNVDVVVHLTKYAEGDNIALVITDDNGYPLLKPTVNIPEYHLPPGLFYVKDWSENEGVLEALVKHNVVIDTGKRYPINFVEAAICRLGSAWSENHSL